MFDEFERLCQTPPLQALLARYAEAGKVDRAVWQDRVMEVDGLADKDLTRLHGELIAYGWIEQNTGATPALKPGVAAACYRVTPAGLRAHREGQEKCAVS